MVRQLGWKKKYLNFLTKEWEGRKKKECGWKIKKCGKKSRAVGMEMFEIPFLMKV